jgi:hypothetical protein
MAKPGTFPVTVGGEVKQWRLDTNDMCEVEALLQVRRGEKLDFVWGYLPLVSTWTSQDYRLVLWAGLRYLNKDLTEQDVGAELSLLEAQDFRLEFSKWANSMMPDSLKKKVLEYQTKNGKS